MSRGRIIVIVEHGIIHCITFAMILVNKFKCDDWIISVVKNWDYTKVEFHVVDQT